MNNLLKGLENKRTFSQYPTGKKNITSMYRWDDTKEVINCKSVVALVKKGILKFSDISIKEQIVNN